jgi:hypothetical protein
VSPNSHTGAQARPNFLDMSTFALVTIVVCCASAVIAAYLFARTVPALDGVGRGGLWMDHQQDLPLEDQPSQDDPDLPLPKRALRGRFE